MLLLSSFLNRRKEKNVVLKACAFVRENNKTKSEVFYKMVILKNCNFIKKETLVQVFSREFCEISKNTFLHRTPLVVASESRTCHYGFPERFNHEMVIMVNTFFYRTPPAAASVH